MDKRFIILLTALMLLLLSSLGLCYDPYNPEGKGVLCFNNSPYRITTSLINKNELSSLWFYDLTLTAEQAPIYINRMGINLEAHKQIPKTTAAMLESKHNTNHIWVYVQYLLADQKAITNTAALNSPNIPRIEATSFRTIPEGEVSSQRNMFVAEFENINIIVRPGEKVILSFFGDFNPNTPTGTKISGHNLVPLWSYSGNNMRFNETCKPSEFIVQ